jgi:carboxyl-terminal processing protease
MTPEELKAKGIEDFQLWYAINTIRRTIVPAPAARAAK